MPFSDPKYDHYFMMRTHNTNRAKQTAKWYSHCLPCTPIILSCLLKVYHQVHLEIMFLPLFVMYTLYSVYDISFHVMNYCLISKTITTVLRHLHELILSEYHCVALNLLVDCMHR